MSEFLKMKGLVFVLQKNTRFGYRAFESRHSMMIMAKSRPQLINEIKKEVNRHFDGRFYGKVVLRGSTDEEIRF